MTRHIPVLLEDVLNNLDIQKDDIVLDGTAGFGGHSEQLLNKLDTSGTLICCDQDKVAIEHCKTKFDSHNNVLFYNINYSSIFDVLKKQKSKPPNKILIDLGFSSFQLDSAGRGFSFLQDEPLDMRMDTSKSQTAAKILNAYNKNELSDLFFNNGELYHNKKLSENIVIERKKQKIETTFQLVEIIKKSYFFSNSRKQYMKVSSQIFQALRIEVNKEFDHMLKFLQHAIDNLPPEGRIAIITFHSTEDRLVKQLFKPLKKTIAPIHKKVIQATQEEIRLNSRSKPAKLRTYIKVA
ncbi:16S rRNA (cytosine(1402)-N(4))-methyltransferase [Candidatus Marinamargulisbacteria bacterium SCGC AAA071-K20]|nr:16S rRNA (cytosine(1402)-N(4))-methyltransferase [Candidatus Marinamargulisbacteria bacterium SCGC AAA071-K20]